MGNSSGRRCARLVSGSRSPSAIDAGLAPQPKRIRATRSLDRIGLVSDTHGLLRPEAVAFLRGSDFIVHAGDIGDAAILDELAAIAAGRAAARRLWADNKIVKIDIAGGGKRSSLLAYAKQKW